jgi:predicted O-methyltransferase YrrM|tara:strand:- start:928 stop:1563 length:636 start_codon:yes stop_codon:yes gene_type:complete
MSIDKINNYVKDHSCSETKLLSELRRETELKCINPIMLSGEYQGRLLSLISKIKQPKKILEIGTFTGYSTLCLVEGLETSGKIYTIDKNEELIKIQNKYFSKSKYHKNIKQYTGDALEIIPKINSKFDLIFLDADKENYNKYLEIIIPKLNKKGILISDNVLWHGKVLIDKKNQDKVTKRIDTFNKDLVENKNFQTFMLPIRDGLSISIKL